MSDRQISIAVDAMGGENSPYKVLKGIEIFQKNHNKAFINLFGSKDIIEKKLLDKKINLRNYKIYNTTDDVTDLDNANTILRSRKDSSIFKGLEYVKNNKNSGFRICR